MKTRFLLFAFLFMVSFAFGQVSETREAKPFKSLNIVGAPKVIYTQSETFSVKVEGAQEEDLKRVELEYYGDQLTVRTTGTLTREIRVYISGNHLEELIISGASQFENTNSLQPRDFLCTATGASKAHLKLSTGNLKVVTSGASDVNVEGRVEMMDANISGASSLKAAALSCNDTDVDASGAASAKVVANKKLKAKASGAASIRYSGDPSDISTEVTTASSIRKQN